MNSSTSPIVYSTGHGRICPECSKPVSECSGKHPEKPPSRGDGTIRISLDTKGRKGKDVTVITGIPLNEDGLENLAKQLKQKCGAGGTVKERIIEIQGDHRDTLLLELQTRGYRVKLAGG